MNESEVKWSKSEVKYHHIQCEEKSVAMVLPVITFGHGFMAQFISVHFLGQEYRLVSPDDLRVIEHVGSWGQD